MEHQGDVFPIIQDKISKVTSRLDKRLQLLVEYGLITDIDKQKMSMDALYSAEAILKAVRQSEYPPNMQKELAIRLLDQFEHSVTKILQKAESRAFSKKFLAARLSQIEFEVATELGEGGLDWYRTNLRTLAGLRKRFISDIQHRYKERVISVEDLPAFLSRYKEGVSGMMRAYVSQLKMLDVDNNHFSADRGNTTLSSSTDDKDVYFRQHLIARLWRKLKGG